MQAFSNSALLLLPPTILCAGAVLVILFGRVLSSAGKGVIAALCSFSAFAAVLGALMTIRGGAIDVVLRTWDGPLAVALHADALSLMFAVMGTLLGGVVLLYSVGYMAEDRASTRFYATMLLFIGGFVALVFCSNLFLLYFCWEVIGLCSFSLVGFWYRQPAAVRGARKVLLMTHVAGYGLLAAILVLYHRTGTALWTDPATARSFSTSIFLLMLIAVLAKSVQVPLHTWIPDAMAAPTPVSSLLHAACYVTAGVYLAARMHSFAAWQPSWNLTLIAFATATMLVGVMYAMVQTDLKRMLAFSTVSQIGYMLLGIGIGTPLAIAAGLLHCLNHGFFKGGLFLNAGAIQHATGTRDMNQLGGLAQNMPKTMLWWLVGVGNMAGIPLMSGFVSKWMLYAAALQAGWTVPTLVAWVVSLGTVFICAKATSAVFLGPHTEATRNAHEASPSMQWAMGLMAFGSIVLGVAPQLAMVVFFQPMLTALGLDASLNVTWFGLFTGAGSFSTAGGLVLAFLSFVVGGAIFAIVRVARTAQVHVGSMASGGVVTAGGPGVFTGGESLWNQERLTAGDFSRIFEQNWTTFFRWTNVDRAYALLTHQLHASARLLATPVHWLERRALSSLMVLSAAGLSIAWLAGRGTANIAEALPVGPFPEILAAALCIAAVAVVVIAAESGEDRVLPLRMAVPATLVIAGCLTSSPGARIVLLEAATLISIWPVWKAARTRSSRFIYIAVVGVSVICVGLSEILSAPKQGAWSRALLLTGVFVKVAAVPFFFWLLRLADELPAVLLGLILGVIDIAAVGELSLRVQADPGLFAPAGFWLALALLTSVGAAILMLAQRSLKRLLVLSSIEDFGFLLMGIASLSMLGREGVLLAAVSHAIAKSLLFVSLAGAERDGALAPGESGLAQRYPFGAFGFLVGMLAMLGVPPLLGYAGRWKLYETALRIDPWLLGGFLLASVLSLIAYTMAFTNAWWGPSTHVHAGESDAGNSHTYLPAVRYESSIVKTTIVILVFCLAVAGLWPQFILNAFQGGRP